MVSVRQIDRFLEQWQMDLPGIYTGGLFWRRHPGSGNDGSHLAAGPRLDSLGAAQALGREDDGPPPLARAGLPDFRAVVCEAQQAELRAAVQELPAMAGIELANWNWRVVHQFVLERFGIGLSRSGCLNYLHRLGFAFKRPKKRLLKADGAKREAFVAEYAALTEEARRSGARIFFADEAHFRADAELRGKWVLRGEPALVDSTPALRREGQLLLCGVLGDWRGGVDGTGG